MKITVSCIIWKAASHPKCLQCIFSTSRFVKYHRSSMMQLPALLTCQRPGMFSNTYHSMKTLTQQVAPLRRRSDGLLQPTDGVEAVHHSPPLHIP